MDFSVCVCGCVGSRSVKHSWENIKKSCCYGYMCGINMYVYKSLTIENFI